MGNFKEAENILDKVPSTASAFYLSDYYYSMGILLEAEKQNNDAIENYQKSLELNSYNIQSSKKLKAQYILSGKKQEAELVENEMNEQSKKLAKISK